MRHALVAALAIGLGLGPASHGRAETATQLSPQEAAALDLMRSTPEFDALSSAPALTLVGTAMEPDKDAFVAATALFWDHENAVARMLRLDLASGVMTDRVLPGARPASTKSERALAADIFAATPEAQRALASGGTLRGGFLYTGTDGPCGKGDRCLALKVVNGGDLLAFGLVDLGTGDVVRVWSREGGWR